MEGRLDVGHLDCQFIRSEVDRARDQLTGRKSTVSPGIANKRLLAGYPPQSTPFLSPMGRVLRPYIFRNRQSLPVYLKNSLELRYQTGDQKPPPSRSSIDYCYLRPDHVPAVNYLLCDMFWPGIDVSDSLSHPEFTVVALYKRLVIGCGILQPDMELDHNSAYIAYLAVRPLWDKAGIGSFMLYHLIQTCQGKDITTHVSSSNPAIALYHKFGFQTDHVALNFYDKYLPGETHALFLRLKRDR